MLVLQVEHHPPLVPRVLESEDTSRILLSNAFPAFSLPTVGRLFYILIMHLQTCSFVAAYLNQMFHRTTPHQVCALHSRMCSVLFDLKKSAGCAVLRVFPSARVGAASIRPPHLDRRIISQPTSKSPDWYFHPGSVVLGFLRCVSLAYCDLGVA